MPRREVLTVKEIYKRRATAWEMHYRNRTTARQIAIQMNDATRVIRAIQKHVPAPEIEFDGYLYRPLDVIKGEAAAAEEIGITPLQKCLMCTWYWSDSGWEGFVKVFQSLPDVEEDYYWTYDAERDGAMLVPMSKKKLRADARFKLGTTEVQPVKLYLVEDDKAVLDA
jgi:hypothetical protein